MFWVAASNQIFRQYFGRVGQAHVGAGLNRFNGLEGVKVIELR